jgi:hypothetical protein
VCSAIPDGEPNETLYKWLIATLAGAATMFVWGGISHMVLFKGIGFSRISGEERIVSALRTSLLSDGLYFLPSIDIKQNATEEEKTAWEARFRAGPTGMIIYHAAGDAPVLPKKLSVQGRRMVASRCCHRQADSACSYLSAPRSTVMGLVTSTTASNLISTSVWNTSSS